MGGSIIRDIFIIHTYPTAFTGKCLPEIIIAFVSTLLYLKMEKSRKRLQWFSVIADSVGLPQCIVIGAEKVRGNFIIAALSGITTALGGEIISSLLFDKSLKKMMLSNLFYRIIITVAGTFFYLVFIEYLDFDQTDAHGILMFYTMFFTSISNADVREAVKMYFAKTVRITQRYKAFCVPLDNNAVIFTRDLRSECLFYKLHKNMSVLPKRPPAPKRSTVLLLHRIRQM